MSEPGGRVSFSEMALRIDDAAIPPLHRAVNSLDGLYVHSLGRGMNVYKENGPISNLTGRHNIVHETTTHGIGHVRMATESAEGRQRRTPVRLAVLSGAEHCPQRPVHQLFQCAAEP